MIPLTSLKSKIYYVVGLARSGQATVKALKQGGAKVFVFDDSVDPSQEDYIKPEDIEWPVLDGLVLSPGIPHTFPKPHKAAEMAKRYRVPILCDVDLLAQAFPKATFIGITGTNGKSTTTALLHHLLPDSHMGGNIGRPVLDLQVDSKAEQPLFLLELSSYQLERVPHLQCALAVLLNITPDHLDRHGGFAGYVEAKKNLCSPLGVPQTVIIGIDEEASLRIYEDLKKDAAKTVIPVSLYKVLPEGISVVTGILYDQGQEVCSVSEIKTLAGLHNYQNIAAAYGVLKSLSRPFSLKDIITFKGLPHRQELVGEIGGVTFVNDSKATNITSTLKALSCFENVHLLLGGVAKASGLSGLETERQSISMAYLFGRAADQFAQELDAKTIPYLMFHTLEEAVKAAFQGATQNSGKSTVLLSPACASFDQFKDFEHRGEAFKNRVHNLMAQSQGIGQDV